MAAVHRYCSDPISRLETQTRGARRDSQDQHERERRGERQRRDFYRWNHSRNRLSDSRVVERDQNRECEERIRSPFGWIPHRPIPAEEEHDSTEHVPRKLNEDLRGNPSGPTIHLTRPFPDFIYRPVLDERYLKLLSTGNAQDKYGEDREQFVLDALHSAWTLPESETDEETRGDV